MDRPTDLNNVTKSHIVQPFSRISATYTFSGYPILPNHTLLQKAGTTRTIIASICSICPSQQNILLRFFQFLHLPFQILRSPLFQLHFPIVIHIRHIIPLEAFLIRDNFLATRPVQVAKRQQKYYGQNTCSDTPAVRVRIRWLIGLKRCSHNARSMDVLYRAQQYSFWLRSLKIVTFLQRYAKRSLLKTNSFIIL